ncbi:MAG: tyrosine-type recombinase/integrase [Paenibacillaceae bacterium]
MSNSIPAKQLSSAIEQMMRGLTALGYRCSTISAYQCALRKVATFMKDHGVTEYSHAVGQLFLEEQLTKTGLSERWYKYIKTAIRRLDGYIQDKPFETTHTKRLAVCPDIFVPVIDSYMAYMKEKGCSPSTIEAICIYAGQLLGSLEKQSVTNFKSMSFIHIGIAFSNIKSKQGFCEKLPPFLKYLYQTGMTEMDFSKAVPRYSSVEKLPSIYTEVELIQLLNSIERTSGIRKRDYAIMALSVSYGLRANDISSLKFSEISDGQLAFMQSKTSVMYQADLLDKVSEALQDYIQNGRPDSDCEYIFIRSSAPYRKLSRSSIWSIVCTYLMKSGINIGSRKRGSHAIRASLATHLVNNDVPYYIVQKILGHQDPNATKRYAAIDFYRLRSCALECPKPSGQFAIYLSGGAWK